MSFLEGVALNQTLGEHTFWFLYNVGLVLLGVWLIVRHSKRDEWGIVILVSIVSILNSFAMFGHAYGILYYLK